MPAAASSRGDGEHERYPMAECERAWFAIAPEGVNKLARGPLLDCVHFLGLNPTKRVMRDFCQGRGTEAVFTVDDLSDLAGRVPVTTQAGLTDAFRLVDADGDGHLTRSELDDLLAKGGERMTRAELDEVMEQFDLDGDGRIDFTEFSQMLVSFSRQMRGMRPPLARREGGEPLSNAEHKPKDRSGSRGRRAAAGASSALKKGFGSLRGKLGRRGSGAEESGSEAGSGAEDGGRLSKSVTESAPEREPSQLRSWDCDRLGGTLQVAAEAGVEGPQFTFSLHEATEVYLTLRMDRGLPGGHRNLDLSLFLMQHAAAEEEAGRAAHGPVAGNRSGRTETDPSTTPPPSLIAVSPTQYKKDPAIRIHLSPGKYTVVPFTTGCKLRKRTAQPSRSVALTRPAGDSHELTAECTKALKQVFQRLDADGRGSVSREEYSFLQVRTDGEPCDDETWEYVSENFNLEDGGLTEQGFLDMYGMFAASCEGDDTQFYPTFKCLGYNQRLQLDEAVMFKMFVFCSRQDVLGDLVTTPADQAVLDAVAIAGMEDKAHVTNIAEGVDLLTFRDTIKVSVAARNTTRKEVTLMCDCSQSKNAVTHRETQGFFVTLSPGETQIIHHLLPDDMSKRWSIKCDPTIIPGSK